MEQMWILIIKSFFSQQFKVVIVITKVLFILRIKILILTEMIVKNWFISQLSKYIFMH